MISARKRGRVTLYFWSTEEKGKTHLLQGRATVTQKAEYLFQHIKKTAGIPRAQLHLERFNDGYAIFDREGCRLYYGRNPKTGRAVWKRTPPVLKVEDMHKATDYDA